MKVSALACLFLSTILCARSHSNPVTETLVITNVSVINTRDGSIAPRMTVVIKHGQIQAVAKFGIVASSPKTRVINGSGKYLIPGLWDMHVHTSGNAAAAWDKRTLDSLYIANGVTGIREITEERSLSEPGLPGKEETSADQELIGPHRILAKSFLGENKSDSKMLAVSVPAARDGSFGETKSIEQLSAVMLACSSREVELRQRGLRAWANHDGAAYAALAAETRATYDPDKAWNLFVDFANRGIRMVPALVWSQNSSNLGSPQLKDDPALQYVSTAIRQSWEAENLRGSSPGDLQEAKEIAARDIQLVGAMRNAGVQFMAGTDSPAAYVIPGFSLHQELQWLVKSGFTPAQALQAATIDPAIFSVQLDKYGVVEKGHVADLVLLDANPLENISNTKKIAAVLFEGKYYSREDLDKLLDSTK
ncbi:MAG TPA: amidohydrolase family protein [Terriglobales bacterium]|nr:amidohydrolase family protein [Terriglobales bacterium]